MIEKVENRLEVLNKVKEIITLPFGELHTLEQVADYYEVTGKAILNIIRRNEDELLEDGYTVYNKEEVKSLLSNNLLLKTKRGGFNVLQQISETENVILFSGSNKGVGLFTTRSVLRLGMLLRDSQVAKEVRTQLLNIHEITTKQAPELVTKPIDYEQQLEMEIGRAIMNEDSITASIKSKELQAWKDRHATNAYDKFLNIDGTYTTTDACKMLGLNRKQTFSWLRNNNLVFQNKTTPTKKAVELRIMKIIIKNGYDTMVITPKGIDFLMKHLKEIDDYKED